MAFCYSEQVQPNSTSTPDSGQAYLCPAWDDALWIPLTRDPKRTSMNFPPGTYVPEQTGGKNIEFLIWCIVSIRANNHTVFDEATSYQIKTLQECISQCIGANRATGAYSSGCTAVSFGANWDCVLKTGSFVPNGVKPDVTLTADGIATTILLPVDYDATPTWTRLKADSSTL